MPSFAAILRANLSRGKGFMAGVDSVPPVMLPFSFAPEEIEDEFDPQFDIANQPGSRYSYPMFKNMGARHIKFKLRFDSGHPVALKDKDYEIVKNQKGIAGSFSAEYSHSLNVEIPLAIIEKLKISRQGIAATLINVLGSFTVTSAAHPGPPLILLSLNLLKYYIGFLSSATIKRIRFTSHMLCTRAEVDCDFLVSPDYIFTTVEDALRDVYTLMGLVR